jgi:hypothetical protein
MTAAWTYNPNGTWDIRTYQSGTYKGTSYASFDVSYSASEKPTLKTYYSSGGAVVATVVLAEADDGILTAAFSDEDIDATPLERTLDRSRAIPTRSVVPMVNAPVKGATQPESKIQNIEALMLGAKPMGSDKAGDVGILLGGNEIVEVLAAALFLGGMPLPRSLKAKTDRSRAMESNAQPSAPLAIFDILEDRFETMADHTDLSELPSAMHSDQGAVDWIVMR